jgi:FKBP-type peptidyl-prolyl cis-trans isomerase SlyD
MKIEQNKIVTLSYKLEANGNTVEEVTKEKPVQFMYGIGYLLPKFEEQIANMIAGDHFDFTLQAADAYGEINEEDIVELPKDVFEIDGKFDEQFIKIGNNISLQDQDGNRMYGTVEAISNDTVTMNFNHPYAGSALHFAGEIVNVREASPEDLSGSCCCGCNCSDDDCCEDDDCCCNCD